MGAVEKVVTSEGYGSSHSEHLGYILTCPSNLGTGLRASMMVKLPKLGDPSNKDFFKAACKKFALQPRGSSGVTLSRRKGTEMITARRLEPTAISLAPQMYRSLSSDLSSALVASRSKSACATCSSKSEGVASPSL